MQLKRKVLRFERWGVFIVPCPALWGKRFDVLKVEGRHNSGAMES